MFSCSSMLIVSRVTGQVVNCHAEVPHGKPDEDDVLRGCSDGHYPLWRSDTVVVGSDTAVLGHCTAPDARTVDQGQPVAASAA